MTKYDNVNKLVLPCDVLDKFIKKLIIPKDITQCWLWKGIHSPKGYARWSTCYSKSAHVSRIIYELIFERIEEKLVIDHLCCNKSCVNPNHLEIVTMGENTKRGNTKLRHNDYCKNGHKRTLDNIYIRKNGFVQCRKCLGIYHPDRLDRKPGINHNTFKTICIRGHKFDEQNTGFNKDGSRYCKSCKSLSNKGMLTTL